MTRCLPLAVVLAAVVICDDLSARPCRPTLVPNGGVFNCTTCHLSQFGGGPRNPFGEAVLALVDRGSCDPFWTPALAQEDADGDGLTNGVELLDPEGTWTDDQPDPGIADDVTNPGVADPSDTGLLPGDVNGDGGVDISDPVAHLNFLFTSAALPDCFVVEGAEPVELTAAGLAILDWNGDGGSDISDPVASLNFQFGGTGAPHALGGDCTTIESVCSPTCQ